MPFIEIRICDNAPFTKEVSVGQWGPQGTPLITSDGVRLGESIILPYSLKKLTVFSPFYVEIEATLRAQLWPPPLQPPWAAQEPPPLSGGT